MGAALWSIVGEAVSEVMVVCCAEQATFQSEPKTDLLHLVLRMSEGHNSPLTAQTPGSEGMNAAKPGALAWTGQILCF